MMQTEVQHLVVEDRGEVVPMQSNATFCNTYT